MGYTIKQVSEMTGIPATTLRYYDKEGLLPFLERKESGYRIFNDADLTMLQVLECLKSTGMSIQDMKQFAKWTQEGDASLQQRYAMFLDRKKEVESQMEELQKTLDVLEHKCKYYETALKEGTEKRIMQTYQLPHADEFICKTF